MSFSRQNIEHRRRQGTNSSQRGMIIMIILALFGIFFYSIWSVGSVIVPASRYTIDKGYTPSLLAEKLDLDVSSWRYALWIRFFAPSVSGIQAGTYETSSPVTIRDFLTKSLKRPLYTDLTIMILPGWSMYDIDDALARKQIIRAGEFIETAELNFSIYQKKYPFLSGVSHLEGFFYPDTYRIPQDATADDIIHTLLRQFGKKIAPTYTKLDPKRAYETLILASIVEREENNIKNQPIVAGILAKRIAEKMPMGADATVCYGYAKTQKQCTPSFIGSVIRDKNTYNTRSTLGYPPTPISSISEDTWRAALNPQKSEYYYYLHGDDGAIYYARTNGEHVINKNKYLK